ncbi:MAG: STAS domain-containing protein [Phycisphaerales bacterium]|nr:STAS domain-containing protein [Phycisphaerales bacterium]
MNITWEDHGVTCVVEVDGELVGQASDSLSRTCFERFEDGARNLVIDLSKSGIVDSLGLETLLRLSEETVNRNGRCPLVSLDPLFASILELTGLRDRLEIHDSVTAAARTLR